MPYCLSPDVKVINENALGDLVFLFNPRYGSWVVITPPSYQYLEKVVEQKDDPLSLGLQMGFSKEEIDQFFVYLLERNILVKCQQSYQGEDDAKAITLQSCYLHVTSKCNLSCHTCYSWKNNRNMLDELSLGQIERILDQLASLRLQHLVISGGEPLTRKDLAQILRLAKERFCIPRITVITNGTLATNERALSIAPYVDEIAISLDGPTEEINAQIRGKGNFKRALKGVRIFKSSSIKSVKLVATLTHINVRYLQDFQDLAQKLGIQLSFSMFVDVGAGSFLEAQNLGLTQEDLEYLAQAILKMGGIQIDLDGIGTTQTNMQQPLHLALGSKAICGAGSNMVAIDYDGSVYPCHMLMRSELCMGNVLQLPLSDILAQSNVGKLCRSLHVEQIQWCNNCAFRYFCGGGCRASAYSMNRSLQSQDPACYLYQAYIRGALAPILGQATPQSVDVPDRTRMTS